MTRRSILSNPHATNKSNDWYTEARYIDAAKAVMGGIDLDVASCEFANRIVRAARYYTKQDNGLTQPWYGRVWCNPPYGRTTNQKGSYLEHFSRRLIDQYERGNVEQAILLIPANTGTSWFPFLCKYSLCFPPYRLRFYQEQEVNDGAAFSSVFVYLGTNTASFIEVFGKIGPILKAISITIKPTTRELWQEVQG